MKKMAVISLILLGGLRQTCPVLKLGYMYANGEGVEVNPTEAAWWLYGLE